MCGQAGFWDIDERYAQLSQAGDPLEKLNSVDRTVHDVWWREKTHEWCNEPVTKITKTFGWRRYSGARIRGVLGGLLLLSALLTKSNLLRHL